MPVVWGTRSSSICVRDVWQSSALFLLFCSILAFTVEVSSNALACTVLFMDLDGCLEDECWNNQTLFILHSYMVLPTIHNTLLCLQKLGIHSLPWWYLMRSEVTQATDAVEVYNDIAEKRNNSHNRVDRFIRLYQFNTRASSKLDVRKNKIICRQPTIISQPACSRVYLLSVATVVPQILKTRRLDSFHSFQTLSNMSFFSGAQLFFMVRDCSATDFEVVNNWWL